jgi:hypothetical protein
MEHKIIKALIILLIATLTGGMQSCYYDNKEDLRQYQLRYDYGYF